MTALDAASLRRWESVADWGTWFVIIGVAGEGLEILVKCFESRLKKKRSFRHFFHKADPWINLVGGIFWIMVVLGLCAEFRGNHKAKVIIDTDNAELHGLASAADERSKQLESTNASLFAIAERAKESAAKATEEAEKAKTEREKAEAGRLALQAKVLELEVKSGRRHLTDEKAEMIERSLATTPRINIWIECVAFGDEEAEAYTSELVAFFKKLKYEVIESHDLIVEITPKSLGVSIGAESTVRPKYVGAIQQAFENAGIPMPGFFDARATNMAIIRVGSKAPY